MHVYSVLSVMTDDVWSCSLNNVRAGNNRHVVGSETGSGKLKIASVIKKIETRTKMSRLCNDV